MGFLNLGQRGRCVPRFASSYSAASKGAAASAPLIMPTRLILHMNPVTNQSRSTKTLRFLETF